MKPPALTVDDEPKYAFTIGEFVTVLVELPNAPAPALEPCVVASASGCSVAVTVMLLETFAVAPVPRYALTVGVAFAVEELSRTPTTPLPEACDVALERSVEEAVISRFAAPAVVPLPSEPSRCAAVVPFAVAVACEAPMPTKPPPLPSAVAVAVFDDSAWIVTVVWALSVPAA